MKTLTGMWVLQYGTIINYYELFESEEDAYRSLGKQSSDYYKSLGHKAIQVDIVFTEHQLIKP